MGSIMDKLPKQMRIKEPEAEREKVLSRMQQDDFLLKQIDEFREKAKQLQSILVTKENKVDELQGVLEGPRKRRPRQKRCSARAPRQICRRQSLQWKILQRAILIY